MIADDSWHLAEVVAIESLAWSWWPSIRKAAEQFARSSESCDFAAELHCLSGDAFQAGS